MTADGGGLVAERLQRSIIELRKVSTLQGQLLRDLTIPSALACISSTLCLCACMNGIPRHDGFLDCELA